MRLILNLSAQPDEVTPSVNDTTVREVVPDSIQFKRIFPHILQEIWEADLYKGPVQVSKLGVTDTYHCSTLQPYQVEDFDYVIPSAAYNNCIIICINLVLSMGWVEFMRIIRNTNGSGEHPCTDIASGTGVQGHHQYP